MEINSVKIEITIKGKKYVTTHKISHGHSINTGILKGLILEGAILGLGKTIKAIDADEVINVVQKMELLDGKKSD